MEQEKRRLSTVTFEIEPDGKRWLELQAAQRIEDGRPHGERSIGAVVRDLINERRELAEQERTAA